MAGKRECFIRRSTRQENFDHMDVFITHNGREASVDVKMAKRDGRGDVAKMSGEFWIEYKAVNFKPGWLLSDPGPDFIAFEREQDFLLVSRKKLQEICLEIRDEDYDDFSYDKKDIRSKGKFYSRKFRSKYDGEIVYRKDMLYIITLDEMKDAITERWLKNI